MTLPIFVHVENQFLSHHTKRNEVTTQSMGYNHYATILVHVNLT